MLKFIMLVWYYKALYLLNPFSPIIIDNDETLVFASSSENDEKYNLTIQFKALMHVGFNWKNIMFMLRYYSITNIRYLDILKLDYSLMYSLNIRESYHIDIINKKIGKSKNCGRLMPATRKFNVINHITEKYSNKESMHDIDQDNGWYDIEQYDANDVSLKVIDDNISLKVIDDNNISLKVIDDLYDIRMREKYNSEEYRENEKIEHEKTQKLFNDRRIENQIEFQNAINEITENYWNSTYLNTGDLSN